ncbi:MAG: hypothetical protein K2H39_03845, partial [Paramuribaculum sp.]|nr:hypothetical protein [Paramuribaculum sp.]
DKATDRYTYTEIPAVIKFDMPVGGTKMKYVSAANTTIDVANWNDYDPATGITLPEDAVFGQTTTIQILAFDDNDEAGIVRTVVCERIAPKAPNKPAIIQYSKSFDYTLDKDAGVQAKVNPGSWVPTGESGVLYADKNALVIDLMEPYNYRYKAQNNHDFTEKPVGTLEYALTSYPTPDAGTTFYEATTFNGSSAATDQNTWGNQNTWFVTGIPDEYKVNGNIRNEGIVLNNQGGNLLQSIGRDYYLHLRAYKETSTGEKIYGDILTIKVEYTPLDAPVLSKPSNEKYSWTGGAISRMTFAGSAIVNVVLPENAPEGTYIEYTFEGGTSHNVIPATISRHKVDGSNRIIVNSMLMENQRNGRIFLHAKNDAQGIESEWVMFDIEQLQTQNFYTDNYAEPTGGFNQNALVLVNGSGANAINDKLRVVDVFATDAGLENGKTTYYVYLEDYFHNGLRLIV